MTDESYLEVRELTLEELDGILSENGLEEPGSQESHLVINYLRGVREELEDGLAYEDFDVWRINRQLYVVSAPEENTYQIDINV